MKIAIAIAINNNFLLFKKKRIYF